MSGSSHLVKEAEDPPSLAAQGSGAAIPAQTLMLN